MLILSAPSVRVLVIFHPHTSAIAIRCCSGVIFNKTLSSLREKVN
jgi:hypothetical protein